MPRVTEYLPSPEAIRAECERLQARWSEGDYLRRRLGGPCGLRGAEIDKLASFILPEAKESDLGLQRIDFFEYPIPSSFEASSFEAMTRR